MKKLLHLKFGGLGQTVIEVAWLWELRGKVVNSGNLHTFLWNSQTSISWWSFSPIVATIQCFDWNQPARPLIFPHVWFIETFLIIWRNFHHSHTIYFLRELSWDFQTTFLDHIYYYCNVLQFGLINKIRPSVAVRLNWNFLRTGNSALIFPAYLKRLFL